MAEKEIGSVEDSKGGFLVTVRNELISGNFDEAKRLEREYLIPPNIISSIANSVYDGFIKEKKFKLAVYLAKKYELSSEKVSDAILMEFRNLIGQGKCEDAVEWGIKNGLPDFEIRKAAVKGIEIAIMDGDAKKAVKLKNDYSITEDQIGDMWQKGYDKAFGERRYLDAALFSKEFGSSERKTILTASKALKNAIHNKTFSDIIIVEREFRFFNDPSFDLLGDDEAKSVVESFLNFIDLCLKNNDGETLVKVVDSVRILYGYYTNHHLKGLVHMVLKKSIETHGNLMKENKYDEARTIKDQLGLFEEQVPMEIKTELLGQALEFHNRLLKEDDLETAKKVKDEYQLMGVYSSAELIDSVQKAAIECLSNCIRNGMLKKANFIIEDYNIPTPDIKEIASEDLKYLLESEKYDFVFNTLLKFKISTDDEELKEIAEKSFEKCMGKGYYEIAADMGYVFEIKNPNVKKAAKTVWERLMDAEDYGKARIIKKKHRLTKKDTQEIAQKAYDVNIEKRKIDVAKKIRDEYGIDVGFIKWLIELIKSILRLLFKTE